MVLLQTSRRAVSTARSSSNCRHASLLRRPKRPYTFTQLVTLSDGSTYLHRTSSPAPIYKSTKDTRNSPLWNPSSQKLLNVEADDAGRLRAFREKFGRGWDARSADEAESDEDAEEGDWMSDLIGEYGKGPGVKEESKGKESKSEK